MKLSAESLKEIKSMLTSIGLNEAKLNHQRASYDLFIAEELSKLGAVGQSSICLKCGGVRCSDDPRCKLCVISDGAL